MVPGRGEVRVPSVREWRERRDQAGELIHIVVQIPRGPLRRKAWEIFDRWQEEEITFQEAKRRLRELVERAGRGEEYAPPKG